MTLVDTPRLPIRVHSVHASQGRCQAGPPIRCALGTLHNGQRVTITVTATATTAGQQTNAVGVMSPSWDPGVRCNLARARTRIIRPAAPPPPRVTG